MVIEELFVRGKNYPSLNVVGMEGLFGFALTGLLLPGLYFIPGTNLHLQVWKDSHCC